MGDVVLMQLLRILGEFLLTRQAQARLGLLGLALLSVVTVGIRARRAGLAVGAAVVFTLLMTQA
ncbi:hypothetical protein ACF1A5_20350 [Streptomyces sp. NPDC014864]|uniref:hypothetical protein n=1 Tax=Streptomyces sp. NPDC014864 TaxID=3364924 RepID=UPI0037017CF7